MGPAALALLVLLVLTVALVAGLQLNLAATVGGAPAGAGLCDGWHAARAARRARLSAAP